MKNRFEEFDQLFQQYDTIGIKQTDREVTSLKYQFIFHSNAIEGNSLNLTETIEAIENYRAIGGKSIRDYLEARDHNKAFMVMYHASLNKYPLNDRLLKQINGNVIKNTFNEDFFPKAVQAGQTLFEYKTSTNHIRFKTSTENVKIYNTSAPEDIEKEIKSSLDLYANSKEHLLKKLADLHMNIYKVHPFIDGNKRTIRLAITYELLKNGYPLMSFDASKKGEYFESLKDGLENNNSEQLLDFLTIHYSQKLSELIEVMKKL